MIIDSYLVCHFLCHDNSESKCLCHTGNIQPSNLMLTLRDRQLVNCPPPNSGLTRDQILPERSLLLCLPFLWALLCSPTI